MTTHTSDSSAPTPLRSLGRHWRLAVLLSIVGLAAGLALASVRPPHYTAEVRLAVDVGDPSAYAIAGFPLASRELAVDYARWVENGVADGSLTNGQSVTITASPVPDTGVVRIEGTSVSEQAALAGARTVGESLLTRVNGAYEAQGPQLALRKYNEAAPTLAAAQARTEAAEAAYQRALATGTAATREATRRVLVQARTAEASAQLERDAQGERYRRLYSQPESVRGLRLVAGPTVTGDDGVAAFQRFGVLGLGAGLALALVLAVLLDRRGARRTARSDTDRSDTNRSDTNRSDTDRSDTGDASSHTAPDAGEDAGGAASSAAAQSHPLPDRAVRPGRPHRSPAQR